MAKIRLGTRGSNLALCQSKQIAKSLTDHGHEVDVIILKTTGDVTAGPLTEFGGEGVFTKRLQDALLDGEIDLAVHSLKDLPTDPVDGLKLGSVPEREDPRDALIVNSDKFTNIKSIYDLPINAKIGTGSVRRKAQLLHLRSDLLVQDIRGNVDTRLRKLNSGQFDALVLAYAGLNRLGQSDKITFSFGVNELAPAVGQGALGLEIRDDDEVTSEAIGGLNCPNTFASVVAERTMLNQLRAGCLAPVAAETKCESNQLFLRGVVLSTDGTEKIEVELSDSMESASELGTQVASQLITAGADRLLR